MSILFNKNFRDKYICCFESGGNVICNKFRVLKKD